MRLFRLSRPKRLLLARFALLVAFLFAHGFAALLPAVHAAPRNVPFAAVVSLGGRPLLQRSGAERLRPLAIRQSLVAGDIVQTGANSKVSILFRDGSQVRLGPRSSLQITEPVTLRGRTSFFRVIAGEVWARLRPGRGIQTQYSNLVVRGTEVHLAVAPDGTTTLTVLQGEVQFFNELGEVVVKESQSSIVRPGSAPTQPVTVANPGLIVEWTLDLNRAVLPREKRWNTTRASGELAQRELFARAGNSAADRRALGDAFFDARRFADALVQYRAAQTSEPNDAATALRIGYALLEQGALDEAEGVFASFTNLAATADTDMTPEGTKRQAEAHTGLAWVALERNNETVSETAARRAVAFDAQSAEARLVLALALMRQPNREDAARTELEAMLGAQPASMRPQARSWLALLALSQDDTAAATREAALAVKEAPASGLAHAAAASVAFYTGRTGEALKFAERAEQLDPNSVATLLALGQAQLAEGDVEGGARTAARATALDPDSAQAFYLLGVADAQRRDYRHAADALQTALRLQPDYLAAAGILARVYVRMNREGEAMTLLADLQKRHPQSDTILVALGETLYEQGKYKEALERYRNAVKVRSNSALAWNGLARLALDANQLNEAINAGLRATELAPQIGEFHATLGLAYSYSRLERQAEREYRTALALDPNNAIALVRLGLANREGDAIQTNRTLGLSFVQGFMLDPTVSRDLLRRGIDTEVEARPTSDGIGGSIVNRTAALDGNLHAFTNIQKRRADGPRRNDDESFLYAANDTTYSPRPGTTIYLHGQHRRDRNELPGTERDPAPDDRRSFRLNEGILGIKHRLDDRVTLWGGLFSTQQRTDIANPGGDFSFTFLTPGGFTVPVRTLQQQTYARTLSPEVRLDYRMGKSPLGASVLTLGAARPYNTLRRAQAGFVDGPPGLVFDSFYREEQSFPERIAYAQIAHQFGNRGSIVAQLRHTRFDARSVFNGAVIPFSFFSGAGQESRSFWLPSMVGNLRVNEKTQLRLLAGRRKTEFASSIFAPVSTLLTTEPQTLPNGFADPLRGDTHVYELDAEHSFGKGRLLKLFLFRSTGRNIVTGYSRYFNSSDFDFNLALESNSLLLDKVKRSGLGARYEHQLGRSLFGQAGAAFNRTRGTASFFDLFNQVPVTPLFNGKQAPYQPKFVANLGLNYVSNSGNKAGIFLNYAGAMFADTDDLTATTRPRFGAKTTLDFLIGREPSVKSEVLLRVNNVFNTRQIAYNGVRTGQRRVVLEVVRRF
ncbi:MAG TPA: tetratricopeptide repeat protein [Abditibacteriaceae bacterium]|jgi:tetratricopeptide (TPR) repeat protein